MATPPSGRVPHRMFARSETKGSGIPKIARLSPRVKACPPSIERLSGRKTRNRDDAFGLPKRSAWSSKSNRLTVGCNKTHVIA